MVNKGSGKGKTKALKLLKRLNLESLNRAVKKSRCDVLSAFFTLETHKSVYLLGTIVIDEGLCQELTGRFLQHPLNTFATEDPFSIESSKVVTDALMLRVLTANATFLVHIEDLCYLFPHEKLYVAVQELIQCIRRDFFLRYRI